MIGCNATCTERTTNAFKILVRKLEEKGPLGKHICRWKDAINIWVTDVQFEGVK
jgi:hypothetical protein